MLESIKAEKNTVVVNRFKCYNFLAKFPSLPLPTATCKSNILLKHSPFSERMALTWDSKKWRIMKIGMDLSYKLSALEVWFVYMEQ